MRSTILQLSFQLELTNVIEKNLITVVTVKIDDDFDRIGLPDHLLLDFHFTILKGMVAKLEILFPENR